MQREETPTMATGLERIAAKARCEPKLRFTSLAHHITKERVWESLCQIPTDSAPGVDGQTVPEAKESFEVWIEAMLQSVHRQGYQAPNIRRVYIPKPGKQEKRPLGVPCVADRALQRSAAQVLSAIYEQDFLTCSFGGRPGRGAHQALASLHEVISGRKVEWVLEADLKNFFGSLSHDWMLRFVPGIADIGHLSVLASDDLQTRPMLASEGIPVESTQPGYYGLVIEAGAFPHSRREPFARRMLDSRGRVPPNTVFLRPKYPRVVRMGDLPPDEPQPQVEVAVGFLMTNWAPSRSSL